MSKFSYKASVQSGGCFLVVFGLFWSSFVLAFDGFIARTVWQRLHAQSFATAPGRVTRSEVIRSRGSKGSSSYSAKIFYTYEVNGQKLTGDQYHFGNMSNSDSRWANATVAAHPAGKEVTIHYDPADPTRAVLKTGIEGDELFLALFTTPFNCIMLAIWSIPLARLRRKVSPEAGGVQLFDDKFVTRARMAAFMPVHAALAAAGATGFVLIFVIGFSTGFTPSIKVAVTGWSVVLGAAALAFAHRRKRILSGAEDLVLDEGARTLTLPCNRGRKRPRQVAFREVTAVEVRRHEHRSSKGGTTYSYSPMLELRDGRAEELADWYDQPKADAFSAWLREKLGVEDAPPKLDSQ
ncbi:MAG: DUF3592 domain-containing protein [Verrucomicrobia bacterium]|nr:DUF3592 domain-containing protein [Verrucomicrobiota bacterium]